MIFMVRFIKEMIDLPLVKRTIQKGWYYYVVRFQKHYLVDIE